MQIAENNRELTKSGALFLGYYYNYSEYVAHEIARLETAHALEYVHTIDASVRALCEYGELWAALKVFMCKTNKITNLSLRQYCTSTGLHNNVDTIIKILRKFKHTTNFKLFLKNATHNIDEICKLRKYFNDQTTIKNLHLESDYHTICSIVESNEFCGSIETVDLTIMDIKNGVELTPIPMTRKIKKMGFLNCGHLRHMVEFNIFLERFLALNSTMQELDLYDVPLDTDTVRIISTFIEAHDLTTLSVCCCNTNGEQINILADALRTSSVEKLIIGGDNIEYEEIESIANMLKANPSPKTITIFNSGDNSMTYRGIIKILGALAINSIVREFYCRITIPVIGETLESVRQTFEQILVDNYVLVQFVVYLKLELEGEVCVELTNITDRNKEAFNESRFIKAKVAAR